MMVNFQLFWQELNYRCKSQQHGQGNNTVYMKLMLSKICVETMYSNISRPKQPCRDFFILLQLIILYTQQINKSPDFSKSRLIFRPQDFLCVLNSWEKVVSSFLFLTICIHFSSSQEWSGPCCHDRKCINSSCMCHQDSFIWNFSTLWSI